MPPDLTPREFTIGRNQDCDIPIADDSVSRVHASICFRNGAIHITDRQSRNGTRLIRNRQTRPIQQEDLLLTDQIQFGEVTLPVADIVEALHGRQPQAAAPSAPVPRKAQGQGAPRMRRCACGVIRQEGQICPECST